MSIEARMAAVAPPATNGWAEQRDELARRAERQGLLDVAYTEAESPIGVLLLAATPAGVVRLAFDNEPTQAVLAELAARVSPRVLRAPARLDRARRELDEYFDGRRTRFELTLDWALTSGFRRSVLDATARIPYGHTGTYRSVATMAGSPQAVRAAGTALATNPIPIIVPCHRVLRSDGTVGQYRGGTERKAVLLRLEGRAAA
jgi:methylated-DNA-[protein]-cysteine S-methyltransferase